jgi:multidrug efflux pump subunit AcrB
MANAPKLPRRGPIAWMAKNSVAANILILILLLGGLMSLSRTKQEVFPEFALDVVTVQVAYPGASPEEVEQGIVLAVEEAVRGIEGVQYVKSTASEGMAAIRVELLLGSDADKVLAEVKSAVDRIQSFPQDAERPISSLVMRRREVISLVIAGDQDPRTLHALAEKARADLLALPGITQVELVGVRPVEVSISLSREALEAYGLSMEEVARQVSQGSVELPGGGVKTRGGEVLVRLSDRRRQGAEFADLIMRSTQTGAEVRLGDVATITDGYAETDKFSFYNGRPAVRVTVFRVGEETPKSVATTVRDYAERLRAELPENLEVAIWNDDSQILQARLDLLLGNAFFGFFLVFLTLALFLRLRVAFWVVLGIPASFLGAFLLLPSMGMSINMMTLFAFIVVLGMVVDDAIVVGENITALEEQGKSRMQAAIEGARRMLVPVTFSVLTTLAAFAPLLFVPGTMGKIFYAIPVVVIAVLIMSLVESFFILPAHLGHGSPRPMGKVLTAIDRVRVATAQGLAWFGQRVYRPSLERALAWRFITVAIGLALVMVAVGAVASGRIPFTFFPRLESDMVTASVRLPFGAPVERTLELKEVLEASAKKAVAEAGGAALLRGVFTRVGEGPTPRFGSPDEVGGHLLTVEMSLVPSDEREIGAEAISGLWAKHTPPLAGVEILTFAATGGPGSGKPVDVQLSHPDIEVIARASEEVTEVLRGYPALKNVENAFSRGKPQLNFKLLPQARALGLTSADVARQLRSSFFGAQALREQRGRDELRVMVRLPEEQRRSEFDIEELLITTPQGGKVPLSYVASYERGRSPTAVRRENGRRIMNVTAEQAPGVRSPQQVLASLRAELLPKLKESYPGLQAELVGQQREQAESFGALGQNFLLALLVIYVLLAIPLRSYVQPALIMTAIPFGMVGALIGHVVLGYGLSLMSVFGIIALAGVVVNNSLVLVDATNELRAAGHSPREAITAAGMRRLRPILLTSLTTFLGLAPIMLERSMQARFLIPMAISLAFGVLFSTFVVLLLLPTLYVAVEDLRAFVRRLTGAQERGWTQPEETPAPQVTRSSS